MCWLVLYYNHLLQYTSFVYWCCRSNIEALNQQTDEVSMGVYVSMLYKHTTTTSYTAWSTLVQKLYTIINIPMWLLYDVIPMCTIIPGVSPYNWLLCRMSKESPAQHLIVSIADHSTIVWFGPGGCILETCYQSKIIIMKVMTQHFCPSLWSLISYLLWSFLLVQLRPIYLSPPPPPKKFFLGLILTCEFNHFIMDSWVQLWWLSL